MQLIQSLSNFPDYLKNSVIAIGNFDGVHKGHQALLREAKSIADSQNMKFGVLTFEPHPRALFRPDDPPFRITPHDLKMERLAACAVDFTVELEFDWNFASQPAEDFVQNILMDALAASHIVIGYDFCFGQLRKGSSKTIEGAGLPVTAIPKIEDGSAEKLSSSRVRQLLRHGKIDEANQILGWDWEIRGIVQKGDQRGRELGYPTANMTLGDTVHPSYGVYAGLVQIEGEDIWRKCAINIGIRPMFEVPLAQVETYIFDFSEEIYGKTLRIRPVERMRGEAKFDSLEALVQQMDLDCQRADQILSNQ